MNSEVISKSNATPDRIFKVIVIGDSNVGKTSLTYRFCEGKFLPFAEATIGVDFRTRIIDVDGEKILVCSVKMHIKIWFICCSVAVVGHGRPRKTQNVHGETLLQKHSCHCICV